MKKLFFAIMAFLFISSGSIHAQTYKYNKEVYSPHLYVRQFGDPYDPALCGVASFFIPGLGQMLSGEAGRGLAFMGGTAGCAIIAIVGAAQLASDSYYYSVSTRGMGTMLIGTVGMVMVNIWSIVDAVRVAKVNNMYIQDMRRQSRIEMNLSPYIEPVAVNNPFSNTASVSVGLTMRMKF